MAQGLTRHEAHVLLAAATFDSDQLAAESLGMALQNFKNTLQGVRRKTDSVRTVQAYHRLVRGIRLVSETTQRIEIEE